MSRFCSPTLVCVLAAFTASCETVSPDLGNGASSYRTAVGGDDADEEEEPQEPALEPEHTCEPGPSADDPESLDGEAPVSGQPGRIELKLSMSEPPLLDDDTLDATLNLETLEPASVSHLVDGQRVPYVLDLNQRVFERWGNYLAEDEHISEWVIDRTFDGLTLDCETVFENAQQTFIKTCSKTLTKSLKAELFGSETPRADLGSTLSPKPAAELTGSVKAYDVQLTYTYDLLGNQLSDPDFTYKPRNLLDNLQELEETGALKTPVQYELTLRTSQVVPGCLFSVLRYTEQIDGESEVEFHVQWEVEF